jgi:GNAT superfamily N-acetyltransferase
MRPATRDDLPELLRMGRAFCAAISEGCERESIVETLEMLIDEDFGVLLYDEGAMVGGLLVPHFFDKSRLMATELFWWVDEEVRGNGVGVKLLNGLESWARAHGAERLSMMSMTALDKGVGKIYERHGFKHFESHYVKVI